jgi:hypothetical protein
MAHASVAVAYHSNQCFIPLGTVLAKVACARNGTSAESVKRFETLSYDAFCATSSAGSGSLIQAMVGRLGGSGLRCRNLAGLAA